MVGKLLKHHSPVPSSRGTSLAHSSFGSTNIKAAPSKHKLLCEDALLHNASVCPWLPSWQGDDYLGKAALFTLDVSSEWFFCGAANIWLLQGLLHCLINRAFAQHVLLETFPSHQTNSHCEEQPPELHPLLRSNRTVWMEARLLLSRELFSLYIGQGTARSQLVCSLHGALDGDGNITQASSPL